jgi:sulfotransferase family protein
MNHPRPIFVLGVPRSGTTLIGNYLGSSPGVENLAEYGGFYVAYSIAPSVIERIPGFHHDAYLAELRDHARSFAERRAVERGAAWYLDHTPWNLEVGARLAANLPDALFVLTLRHYAGTILSLHQFHWGGDTWADSARIWATLCDQMLYLPGDRLIAVGYDAMAEQPEKTLAGLTVALDKHGFPTADLDTKTLAVSHAAIIGQPRPVIGVASSDGGPALRPVRSLDAERWSGDIHAQVWPVVKDTHFELLRRFPGAYRCPPQPGLLRVHDNAAGLVEYDPPGW